MRLNTPLMWQSVIGFLMSWQSLERLSSLTQFHQWRNWSDAHIVCYTIFFSHATNDCNILGRQIQSAINEGWLVISGM